MHNQTSSKFLVKQSWMAKSVGETIGGTNVLVSALAFNFINHGGHMPPLPPRQNANKLWDI